MRKLFYLVLLVLILVIPSSVFAGYVQTWKTTYSTTTERSNIILKGDFYVSESTNTADADVVLASDSNYPIKLYEGDLQVVTTGYGITFADGSLQTTAGVGSASAISSTGTVVINSDSDGSGDESIIFRTLGATERMRINGADGYVGIGTASPSEKLHLYHNVALEDLIINIENGQIGEQTEIDFIAEGLTHQFGFEGSGTGTPRESSMFLISRGTAIVLQAGDTNGIIEFYTGGIVAGNKLAEMNDTGLYLDGILNLENVMSLDYDSSNFELNISTDINVVGTINAADDLITIDQLQGKRLGLYNVADTTHVWTGFLGRGQDLSASFSSPVEIANAFCILTDHRDLNIAGWDKGASPTTSWLYVDVDTDRIGILDYTPSYTLDVNGAIGLEGTASLDYDAVNFEIDVSTAVKAKNFEYDTAQTRYYAISSNALALTQATTVEWTIDGTAKSVDDYIGVEFSGGVQLPHGAIVTSMKTYWYRNDASASGEARLWRMAFVGGGGANPEMAVTDSNSTAGDHSVEDTSISSATIDNLNYAYAIYVATDPNDDANDVRFYSTIITYTVTDPLP